MIKIGYFATIREFVGKKEENFHSVPDILTLMRELCGVYGKAFREFCMDGDLISGRVNILVNGKHIRHLNMDLTPLEDDDEVSIFPLIGGG